MTIGRRQLLILVAAVAAIGALVGCVGGAALVGVVSARGDKLGGSGFGRFTAQDVSSEFQKHGLYAADAHPLPPGYYPSYITDVPVGTGGQINSIFQENRDSLMGIVFTFKSSADMETAWQYINAHAFGGAFYTPSYLRNANVILMFLLLKNSPDVSTYKAVFVAMR